MKNTRTNGMTFTRKPALQKVELILKTLRIGKTRIELESFINLDKRTLISYLAHLHATGQIHIAAWTRDGEHFYPRPIYKAGAGVDAPKPGPLTETEKQKRAWARLKADPERYISHLYKQRKNRFTPRPDIAAAWLFGEAA